MSAQPLLMLYVAGQSLTAEDRQLLRHPGTGALILFSRNYDNPAQLDALIGEIRGESPDILIAVDQEGGRVQRFRDGFTRIPPMRTLGHLFDRDAQAALLASHQLGVLMAAELIPHGVDISFAPVLDLDFGASSVIGDRSFHADAGVVVKLVGAFLDGMRAAGMAATGKHFPGHGRSRGDSHDGFVDITATWSEEELDPFVRLIGSGHARYIMGGHLTHQQLDPSGVPVTFSTPILTGILRERLGFDGIIMTDDLDMGAIRSHYDQRTAVIRSIQAGNDVIMMSNSAAPDPELPQRFVEWVLAALESGDLSEGAIRSSYRRIIAAKAAGRILPTKTPQQD